MSSLRAACLNTRRATLRVQAEAPAPIGRVARAMCVTADRDDPNVRVVHVATDRDVSSRSGWYRVRVWRELPAISAN